MQPVQFVTEKLCMRLGDGMDKLTTSKQFRLNPFLRSNLGEPAINKTLGMSVKEKHETTAAHWLFSCCTLQSLHTAYTVK